MANRIVTRAAIPATENFSAQVVSRSPVPDAVSSEASDAANGADGPFQGGEQEGA